MQETSKRLDFTPNYTILCAFLFPHEDLVATCAVPEEHFAFKRVIAMKTTKIC